MYVKFSIKGDGFMNNYVIRIVKESIREVF